MKHFLFALVLLSTVPKKVKLLEDPAVWIAQHGHRKLGNFAGKMMKIDFNINAPTKPKGKGKKR